VPTYETIFITPPNLTESDERATVETMSQVVTDGGGTFTTVDRMGRRRLAYPIKKFEDGVYTRFLYDADSSVTKELERRFRLSDSVLRYLTVSLERDWAVQAKEDAIREAKRRAEAEAAAAEAAKEEAAKQAEAEKEAAEQEAAAGEVPVEGEAAVEAESPVESAENAAPPVEADASSNGEPAKES
jgi:small subunit ribosomal protein S6